MSSSSARIVATAPIHASSGLAGFQLLLILPALAAFDVLAVERYLGDRARPLTIIMVAALALFAYALNGLTDAAEDAVNDAAGSDARRRHATWTLGSATCALLGTGALLWGRGELHAIYALLMAIGILYSVRVIPWPSTQGLKWVRLKDIVLVKNLAIGGTWAGAAFVAPLMDLPFAPGKPLAFAIVGLGYFALTVVNSIYSDLRDEAGDRQAGINTLPVRFGAAACHRGIFMAMGAWTLVLLWCRATGLLDTGPFLLLSAAALGYPLAVWLTTQRLRLGRASSNYVIESCDLLFALGLLALAT